MAYVAPTVVVAGQTSTAAAQNILVNDVIDHETRINSYSGVYTTEAARDAAITSPVEGMHVYLTAPTVPAATGASTFIPTGVLTIYNGTALGWVCVTEVGAITTTNGTTTSGTYTATLSGSPGTNPSVTLVTGATALVTIGCSVSNSVPGNSSYCGVAATGGTNVAAANASATATNISGTVRQFGLFIISGLSAGTNTFTLQYMSDSGTTGTFGARSIMVKGIA